MNTEPRNRQSDTPDTSDLFAVVDIGASSIRMQIGEKLSDDRLLLHDTVAQAVSLGRDSFSYGVIRRQTIEECVRVLMIFKRKLIEYGLTPPNNVRVVATSGLREARNALEFQDRIFIATGFDIEPFDEAELHRVTFLGIQPFTLSSPEAFQGDTIVSEIGGGSTEFLYMQNGDISFCRTFRMGSLRLRKLIDDHDTPLAKTKKILTDQIEQNIQQFQHLIHDQSAKYVAMGGDIRFVVNQTETKFIPGKLTELPIELLGTWVNSVLEKPPEKLVSKYRMSLSDAQSLGPALLAHYLLAKRFQNNALYVADVSMRTSLLNEMANGYNWAESVREQVLKSAKQFGKKFDVDNSHAEHVATLALQLFDDLQLLHQLEPRYRFVLELASYLHEVGLHVSGRSYHKHSMYLIQNSELFGVSQRNLELISLVARYHRRATPQPTHPGYDRLNRQDRIVVAKLASILRVAVALNSSRSGRVHRIRCTVEPRQVTIAGEAFGDLSSEQIEVELAGGMFRDLFGVELLLTSVEISKSNE